jgi:hypothetical protein
VNVDGEQPPRGVRFVDGDSAYAGGEDAAFNDGPIAPVRLRASTSRLSAQAIRSTLRRTVAPALGGALIGLLAVSAMRALTGDAPVRGQPPAVAAPPVMAQPPGSPDAPDRRFAAKTKARARSAAFQWVPGVQVAPPADIGRGSAPLGPRDAPSSAVDAVTEFGFER